MVLGNLRCYGPTQHIKEKYASSFIFTAKIKLPSDEEISKYTTGIGEEMNLDLESAKNFLKNEMNVPESFIQIQIKEGGIGEYLHQKFEKSEPVKIKSSEVIIYGIYFLKKQDLFSKIKLITPKMEIQNETLDLVEVEIPRVENENIVARLFSLGSNLRNANQLDEFAVSQSNLDQIFQKFVKGTEKSNF